MKPEFRPFDIDNPEVAPVAKKMLRDKYGHLELDEAIRNPGVGYKVLLARLKAKPPEPIREEPKNIGPTKIAGDIELTYYQKL